MTTAAYDAQASSFSKTVQWLVEIDLDTCSLDYTTGACTASDQGDGSRCYNTFGTCQDPTNYDRTTTTLRFCLNEVPWDDTANPAFPYLRSFVAVPQRIDPGELFTYPDKITVDMAADWSPLPMVTSSALRNTSTSGEFWRNLIARNRNYVNRPMRIKRGFKADGYTLSDFDQIGPEYKLTAIKVGPDGVKITGESPLADLAKVKVPFAISDDNTLQIGVNASATTLDVLDASEYPVPGDYTRFSLFVKIEDEILRITTNAGGTQLGVNRGQLGTTAATHAAGEKVAHVAYFGEGNGSAADAPRTPVDVIRDLMHWAKIADADIDTDSFDEVETGAWPNAEINYIQEKPETVSKHMQPIRQTRGIMVYMNAAGEFACSVMAPDASTTTYDDERLLLGSVSVEEDDEDRVTRVAFWYSPSEDNARDDPTKYQKGVVVIDASLESANNFGDVKSADVFDAWLEPDTSVLAPSSVRNIARRVITRLRYGVRTVSFALDVMDAGLDVGSLATIQTRHHLGRDGTAVPMVCMIVAKRERGQSHTEYEAIDTNYGGRYFRISPDSTPDYDSSSEDEKQYGYWGDSDNRVGVSKAEGYRFW